MFQRNTSNKIKPAALCTFSLPAKHSECSTNCGHLLGLIGTFLNKIWKDSSKRFKRLSCSEEQATVYQEELIRGKTFESLYFKSSSSCFYTNVFNFLWHINSFFLSSFWNIKRIFIKHYNVKYLKHFFNIRSL